MCPVQHFKEMRPSCQGYIGGTEVRWCTDISRFLCGKRWEQQAIQASTTSSNSTYKSWYHVIAHCHPAIIQLKNQLIPPKNDIADTWWCVKSNFSASFTTALEARRSPLVLEGRYLVQQESSANGISQHQDGSFANCHTWFVTWFVRW